MSHPPAQPRKVRENSTLLPEHTTEDMIVNKLIQAMDSFEAAHDLVLGLHPVKKDLPAAKDEVYRASAKIAQATYLIDQLMGMFGDGIVPLPERDVEGVARCAVAAVLDGAAKGGA